MSRTLCVGSAYILPRAEQRHYFRLLSGLHTYHQLGQQQFPKMGLSCALPQNAICLRNAIPAPWTSRGLADSVDDAWVQQCAEWSAAHTSAWCVTQARPYMLPTVCPA